MTPVKKDEPTLKEIDKELEKALEEKAALGDDAPVTAATPAPEPTTKTKYDRSGRAAASPTK